MVETWRKWLVLVSTFLMGNTAVGFGYAFGFIRIQIQEDYPDIAPETIAAIGGVIVAFGLLFAPIGIASTEYFGARPVTICASAVSAASLLVVWLNGFFKAGFALDFMMLAVCQGVAAAFLFGPSLTVLMLYFENKQLSFATGITNTGCAVGAVLYTGIYNPLCGIYGWRGTMLMYACISLHCLVSAFAFLPLDQLEPSKKLKPPKLEIFTLTWQDSLESLCSDYDPGPRHGNPSSFLAVVRKYFNPKLFANLNFHLILAAAASNTIGVFVPTLLLPAQAKIAGHNVSSSVQQNLLLTYGVLNGIGRLVCGKLGDYAPKYVAFTSFSIWVSQHVIAAATCIIFPFVMHHGDVAFVLFMVFFGLSSGAVFTVRSLLLVNMFGRENGNASFGWFLCIQGAVQVIGYILPAKLDTMGAFYPYLFAFVFLLSAALFCCLCFKQFFDVRRANLALSASTKLGAISLAPSETKL